MSRKSKVFLASHPTSWQTMAQLAEAVRIKQPEYEPVIVVTEALPKYIEWCDQRGIVCYGFNGSCLSSGKKSRPNSTPSSQKHMSRPSLLAILAKTYLWLQESFNEFENAWLGRSLRAMSAYCLFRALLELVGIRFYMKGCLRLLDKLSPDSVFIHADALGNVFAAFFLECKKRGITLVRAPTAYYEPKISASRRVDDYLSVNSAWGAPWINYLIRIMQPSVFYTYGGKTVMFHQPWETLAMMLLGCLPSDPWYMGKSYADVVCVEDELTARRYQEWGVEKNKIVVAGHVDLDLVSQAKCSMSRLEFCKSLGLDPHDRIVGIALPQLYEHGVVPSWEAHWKEIEFIIQQATLPGFKVLCLLHPKSDRKNYLFLEQKHGCHIFTQETAKAIPFLDLLITAGSSTCLWAAQCGIPVVNLGYFSWTVDQFRYLAAVTTADSREDYCEHMARMAQGTDAFETYRRSAIQDVGNFPPLDGGNRERILNSKSMLKVVAQREFNSVS